MGLFTQADIAAMKDNGVRSMAGDTIDPVPPAMLWMPDGRQRWLLTEIYPYDDDMAYGLCDLGIGCPELGEVRLSELETMTGVARMKVERKPNYAPSPDLPLSRLTDMAFEAGKIVI